MRKEIETEEKENSIGEQLFSDRLVHVDVDAVLSTHLA
jgi:hypothetical protein